jgi:hypothetical protein
VVGDVLARYMLALPAAALVVIGLWRNAAVIGPLAGPRVGGALRLATVAFGVYAVLGGVIGMPAPFPPASFLNATMVRDATGIPIELLRSVTGLVIAIAVIRILDVFEQETDVALAEARRGALLLRERERIGRARPAEPPAGAGTPAAADGDERAQPHHERHPLVHLRPALGTPHHAGC